ncbi:MAG: hypothetical protein VB126_03390 [Paludibacter sp.]|nr:hypothetical protein [Paludibacter sp.]
MTERKPKGYWENFQNVKKEIIPLIQKYGRFPSNNEMVHEGKSSLARFIAKYHGGIIEVAKKLEVQTYDESIGRNKANTWNIENVEIEFINYIQNKNITYYPSRYEIIENGSNFYTGITQVFGTYENFKKHLLSKGFSFSKKPKEIKWTLESAIKELEPIVEEIGYFPSQSDLDKLKLVGLRGYISKNKLLDSLKIHFNVKSKLRKNTVSRPSGYWDDSENILKELNNVYTDFGRIPTNKELLELGYGSLALHLKKLPDEILEKYNYFSKSILIKTKDGHYVRSNYELLFDNFLSYNNIKHISEGIISTNSIQKYLFDFKLILSSKKVVYVEIWGFTRQRNVQEKEYHEKRIKKEEVYKSLKLNLIGIPADIYEQSFSEIYKYFTNSILEFNESFVAKPLDINYLLWGSTYNENTLIETLEVIIKNNGGFFPSTNEIRLLNNGEGLISQIQKFGGVQYFKDKLNVDSNIKGSKWTLTKLKNEIESLNGLQYLPSYNELKDFNRLDILGGIQKNGGFKQVALQLKIPTCSSYLKENPKELKTKWTIDYLLSELEPIIRQYNTIPSETSLIKLGRGDLVVGIKINGGFVKMKERLSIDSSRKKWNEENVLSEIKNFIVLNGEFPTTKLLKSQNRSNLIAGINSLGGFNYFRIKLGYTFSKHGKKCFSTEQVIDELKEVINIIGNFPSIDDLEKINRKYLSSRIQSVGGFHRLRKLMGYDSRKK